MVGQKHPGFVAAQHAPLITVANSDGAAVGIRVECDRQIRVDTSGKGEQAVCGAGLFGIGELDGRKRGVGIELLRHDVQIVEPCCSQSRCRSLPADAVHCRERNPDRAGVAVREGRDAGDVLLDQRIVGRNHRCPGDVGGTTDAGDLALDFTIGGGDELRSAREIHLVTVVGGGIVGGGDLDTCRCPEPAHRERHQRCRQWAGEQGHLEPGRCHDLGGGESKCL